ncbi:hypothetical protein R6Q59_000573 [Mikania micrantha]
MEEGLEDKEKGGGRVNEVEAHVSLAVGLGDSFHGGKGKKGSHKTYVCLCFFLKDQLINCRVLRIRPSIAKGCPNRPPVQTDGAPSPPAINSRGKPDPSTRPKARR